MRLERRSYSSSAMLFQSTHSLRSATNMQPDGPPQSLSFNPRTPCGVRQTKTTKRKETIMFQSTHSLRSATRPLPEKLRYPMVSIHALLAECDFLMRVAISPVWSFNPRTPCGVRLIQPVAPPDSPEFQSTHSLRSATPTYAITYLVCGVSIHALLAECDLFGYCRVA